MYKPYSIYRKTVAPADHRKNIEGLICVYALLPRALRQLYQLAIVTSIQSTERERLLKLANKQGLEPDELILTGFVPEDDLIALYNLCSLFVFPSWHEGFGLPALEAMACGRAVIGSDCSSIPEVIGRSDALFDPHNVHSMTEKMEQVLTEPLIRKSLEKHGIEQANKFNWDKTGKLAIAALRDAYQEKHAKDTMLTLRPNQKKRPKLAYVSPLPPERSGIAFYSAELVPELAKYYDIELILTQVEVIRSLNNQHFVQRSVEWFYNNPDYYERVIYHFGNSEYHQHMFALLEKIPGVVVLHDFFLSDIVAHMEVHGIQPGIWIKSLYESHGYHAVRERLIATDIVDLVIKYPCNQSVLQGAKGVIVHSQVSCNLAQYWYGDKASANWYIIPLLRKSEQCDDAAKMLSRIQLALHPDDFVICSFGLLGFTKANHRLLSAWLNSSLVNDKRAVLIFVGENEGGKYGAELCKAIELSGCADRIKITGWVDSAQFKAYLQASDLAVQLRSCSRGETSAAVLDCLN